MAEQASSSSESMNNLLPAGLKIRWPQGRDGSTPFSGTNVISAHRSNLDPRALLTPRATDFQIVTTAVMNGSVDPTTGKLS